MVTQSSTEGRTHARTPSWKEQLPSDGRFTADLIREQVLRIARSPIFAQSARLTRFLRFVVETCLAGEEQNLKEYLIGIEVYDRKPPYHPSIDSIVRTEARRLRCKLKEYYESDGAADPIYIYFRTGSYIPVLSSRAFLNVDDGSKKMSATNASLGPKSIRIVVRPFEVLAHSLLVNECSMLIAETLRHSLMLSGGCHVVEAGVSSNTYTAAHEELKQYLDECSELSLSGSICRYEHFLRFTVHLADCQGTYIWSQHFDLMANDTQLFELSHQVASAVVNRLRVPLFSSADISGMTMMEYSRILAAESLIEQGDAIDWSRAFEQHETVSTLSSCHPRMITAIAQYLNEATFSGVCLPASFASTAKEQYLRALSLDSECEAAHAGIALLLAADGEFDKAERHFRQAFARNPDAEVYRLYGLVEASCGRFDDAWHYVEKAQVIDPFSRRQKIARSRVLYLSRRFECLISEHPGRGIYGGMPQESQMYAALAYLEMGRIDEARPIAHHLRRESIARPYLTAAAAEILARCGDASMALRIAEGHSLLSHDSPISNLRKSLLLDALGRTAAASRALERAFESREPETLWASADPRFAFYRKTATLLSIKSAISSLPSALAELELA